jgi:hypothetical protein
MAVEADISDLTSFTRNVFREWSAEAPDEVEVDGDLVTLRFTGSLTQVSHPEEIVGHHYLETPGKRRSARS